jgi:ribosomal protein L37AE/L43A
MVEMVGTMAGMTHRITHQRVRRLHKMWRCERDGEVWGGGGYELVVPSWRGLQNDTRQWQRARFASRSLCAHDVGWAG